MYRIMHKNIHKARNPSIESALTLSLILQHWHLHYASARFQSLLSSHFNHEFILLCRHHQPHQNHKNVLRQPKLQRKSTESRRYVSVSHCVAERRPLHNLSEPKQIHDLLLIFSLLQQAVEDEKIRSTDPTPTNPNLHIITMIHMRLNLYAPADQGLIFDRMLDRSPEPTLDRWLLDLSFVLPKSKCLHLLDFSYHTDLQNPV